MKNLTDLTLRDCRKDELLEIVHKLTETFGSTAELIVDLELCRFDCLRLKDELRRLPP